MAENTTTTPANATAKPQGKPQGEPQGKPQGKPQGEPQGKPQGKPQATTGAEAAAILRSFLANGAAIARAIYTDPALAERLAGEARRIRAFASDRSLSVPRSDDPAQSIGFAIGVDCLLNGAKDHKGDVGLAFGMKLGRKPKV